MEKKDPRWLTYSWFNYPSKLSRISWWIAPILFCIESQIKPSSSHSFNEQFTNLSKLRSSVPDLSELRLMRGISNSLVASLSTVEVHSLNVFLTNSSRAYMGGRQMVMSVFTLFLSVNSLTPMSGQDRISPYNINKISISDENKEKYQFGNN